MATVFVYLESLADTPLTGASPTLTYWDKSVPGTPVASAVAMTELVGAPGGGYFVDVATATGKEYIGIVDSTSASKIGGRYQMVTFSGETDARIETDIPAILADTAAMEPVVTANLDASITSVAGSVWGYDISAMGNWSLAGGASNLNRKSLTNRLELDAVGGGRLRLWDDNDITVILTWDQRDPTGSNIVLNIGSPAKRLKAA